jgi:GDP-4-dehydro-6-deoxy-D-mannose reductase
MTRYLITGAQGLVGRYLAAEILRAEDDCAVVGIGRSERADGFFAGERRAPVPPELIPLDGRYRYLQCSLGDPALRDLVREIRPDRIFHLASALHSSPESDLLATNVAGTAALMDAAAHSGALVILGSSGSVYGEPRELPLEECHPCNPAELYGVTKLTAEHVARVKAANGAIGVVTARIFNVVGPGQSESHVCGRLALQLARRGPVLHVGSLDTTRDFIDVRDAASALLLLARRAEPGGTYNVATGRETAIRSVLSTLLEISGRAEKVELVAHAGHPAGVRRHVADIARLRALGFSPRRPLVESLRDLLRYHEAQERPG